MVRVAGDTLVLTPPLIITEEQIGEIIDKVTKVIRATRKRGQEPSKPPGVHPCGGGNHVSIAGG